MLGCFTNVRNLSRPSFLEHAIDYFTNIYVYCIIYIYIYIVRQSSDVPDKYKI